MSISLSYEIVSREDGEGLVLRARGGDGLDYHQRLRLEPSVDDDGRSTAALALARLDDERDLLAYACAVADSDDSPLRQYLLVPHDILAQSHRTLDLIAAMLPLEEEIDVVITLPETQAHDAHERTSHFASASGGLLENNFDFATSLLSATLNENGLAIRGFPIDLEKRLALLKGLRALMPAAMAARLTFSTCAVPTAQEPLHLLFSDKDNDDQQAELDWQDIAAADSDELHPYVKLLRAWMQEDQDALTSRIDSLAGPAATEAKRGNLSAALASIAERLLLDQKAKSNDPLETSQLIDALDSATPPQGQLRFLYIKKLLENALRNRDVTAGKRVAKALQNEAHLEADLAGLFDEMLESQPDSVYLFIRNRLNHLGIDDSWIPRLQAAARDSLELAIEEGDSPTLISWLELIAHEPLSYQLQDVLRDGLLSSRERAHESGELGIHLILIAARRLPDIADALYDDQALIAALPAKISQALRDNTAEALEPLIEESAEYFLLALFHALQTSDAQLVTVPSVDFLWTLYHSERRIALPATYRPAAMIRLLAANASHQLTEAALDLHLRMLISGGDRELIRDAAAHLAERDALFPRLSALLEDDDFALEQVLSILNTVSGCETVPARDLIDAYFGLLDYYEWEPATQPMMEALSRLMAKHHQLHVSHRHLWKQFESCNSLRIEHATRIAIAHLLRQFEDENDETSVVQGIARICHHAHWSKNLQSTLNSWWRDYAHRRSLAHLQRLEREMETQRHLEPQKQILRAALAMRRWMPDRDAISFASAMNAACALFEHITDAFDIAHMTEIDPLTIRREMDALGADLSADKRHILANNLRNLAHLITRMAENRSKPSLIRSDDSIDRQLNNGIANPHGSIDMMKWIAGYLDGSHNHSED